MKFGDFILVTGLALGSLYLLNKTQFGSQLFFSLKGSTPTATPLAGLMVDSGVTAADLNTASDFAARVQQEIEDLTLQNLASANH